MNRMCWRRWVRLAAIGTGILVAACHAPSVVNPAPMAEPVTAIVGVTVIDGTGASPLRDATVVVQGRRIRAVGPRPSVRVPANAKAIDGHGLFVLPGFVDANIWGELAPALSYGVTTVRGGGPQDKQFIKQHPDTMLPRLLARGGVIGWDGPEAVRPNYHYSPDPTDGGAGGDLVALDVDSLRVRINRYLDTGVDYIKYGPTTHVGGLLSFSSRAQRAIVEEAHKRGMVVDVHASGVEGLRMAVLAGVDNIVHAEANSEAHVGSDTRPWPEDLIRLLAQRRVVCELYATYPASSTAAPASHVMSINRRNMIRGGCTIAVMSDGIPGGNTLRAMIYLVNEEGMSPMDAIVAGTRGGALACKMLDQFGTVTAGKLADLVVLNADPLQHIKNITKTVMVFAEGRRLDVTPAERDRGWDWDKPRETR